MVTPKLIPFVYVLEEQIIVYEWLEQCSLRCDLPIAMLVSHSFVINLNVVMVFSC